MLLGVLKFTTKSMKRILSVITGLFILTSFAQAQDQKLWLTIEGGPNFGNVIHGDTPGFDSSFDTGFQAGVGVKYRLGSRLELYTGTGFSQINLNRDYDAAPFQSESGPVLPDLIERSYEFMLVEFPLGLSYTLLYGEVKLEVHAGLSSALVSSVNNEPYFYQDENGATQITLDISDEIEPFCLFAETGLRLHYGLDEDTRAFGGFNFGYDMLGVQETGSDRGHLARVNFFFGLAINLL